MKREAQVIALELLRDHPGWSDDRVARELERNGLRAATSSVQAWRVDAGLAPATDSVGDYPPPRIAGVWLSCGHLVHPSDVTKSGAGHCRYCGGDFPLARV